MTPATIDVPIIETERLVLRSWREDDHAGIAEMGSDPDVTRFTGGLRSEADSWRMIAMMMGHWSMRGYGMMVIEEKATGSFVGYGGPWRPFGWPDFEIGYSLTRAHHRKGYATEAMRAALRFAYQNLGWTSAISLIDADNAASQGVARKLGASCEQTSVPVTNFTADIWRHLPPEQFLAAHPAP